MSLKACSIQDNLSGTVNRRLDQHSPESLLAVNLDTELNDMDEHKLNATFSILEDTLSDWDSGEG